jgi:hypothetical protein
MKFALPPVSGVSVDIAYGVPSNSFRIVASISSVVFLAGMISINILDIKLSRRETWKDSGCGDEVWEGSQTIIDWADAL